MPPIGGANRSREYTESLSSRKNAAASNLASASLDAREGAAAVTMKEDLSVLMGLCADDLQWHQSLLWRCDGKM
jgi:hypothetical protein